MTGTTVAIVLATILVLYIAARILLGYVERIDREDQRRKTAAWAKQYPPKAGPNG